MEKMRIGIVGAGGIGTLHASYITEGKISGGELTALCDIDRTKLEKARNRYGDQVKYFDDFDSMLESGVVDGILISTVHYTHPELAVRAFEKGFHVLLEKPAGVYTKQVREMNEAAVKSGKVFSMMYNQRTDPLYRKVRDLVKSGELGGIKRTNWIITSWYRPQSYYDMGTWRATWAGEGGGVLLNQCPHQLDLWQWMCGVPKRVRAFCHEGKYHDIEVEDDVTAYVEYENGATGVFVTSTGDAPGTNRFEISADRGKVVIEDDKLTYYRLRVPERQFNKEYKGGFGSPECWKCEVPVTGESSQHQGITQNWVDAVLKDTPLLAPGVEGIRGLEISNAMFLSSWLDKWVDIPVDEDLFYGELKKRIDSSRYNKG